MIINVYTLFVVVDVQKKLSSDPLANRFICISMYKLSLYFLYINVYQNIPYIYIYTPYIYIFIILSIDMSIAVYSRSARGTLIPSAQLPSWAVHVAPARTRIVRTMTRMI